jgi:predicted metalloprotease with PDZ domain
MTGLTAKGRAWRRLGMTLVAALVLGAAGPAGAQVPVGGAPAAAAPAKKLDAFVYRVGMDDPEKHEFQVELSFSDIAGASVDLQLPKWNPGAYKLTEAHRNVRAVVAEGPGGKAVPVVKVDEITWRVTHGGEPFKVRYRVYRGAYNGIGGAYLDDEFGFFNGVYVFLYAVGHKDRPIELKVDPLPGAQVVTGLPRSGATGKAFRAANYDVLVDAPVHAGKKVDIIPFAVGKTKFRIAAAGIGNYSDKKLIADFTKLAEAAFAVFGGGPEAVPFDDYTFIVHLRPGGRAGLEHLNSTVMGAEPFVFTDPDGYRKFLGLAAHELFHAWNVKRIRPTVLGPFAYEREVHTSMLWFSEGFTSYYAWVMLARAGLANEEQTLAKLADKIKSLQESPGRKLMTVEQASWETWLKPDDAGNAYVDYYTKGMLIGMALDLEIRRISGGQRSVDTVMRELWARYQRLGTGIGPGELETTFVNQGGAAGSEIADLFRRYVHGFDEIDYNRHLGLAGYKLEVSQTEVGGDIEAEIGGDASPVIEVVRPGGPAEKAGLSNGDTIVAIDGLKVSAAEAKRQIKAMAPNTRHTFAVLRGPRLLEKTVTPTTGGTTNYKIVPTGSATYEQLLLRQAWLGFTAPAPTGGSTADQRREAAMKLFKNLNEGGEELEDAAPTTAPPGEKKGKKKKAAGTKPAKPKAKAN